MSTIKVKDGQSVEEILEALKLIELLGPASGERTEGGASQRKEPHEQLIDTLKKTRFKKKKSRKLHWKTKLSRRRARGRRDNAIHRSKRKAEWADRLAENTPESWYDWLSRKSNTSWARKKGWDISLEDWKTYIYPRLEGRVPTSRRINTKRGWTLDNVRWYDNETKELLVDGSEMYMLKRGYIYEDGASLNESPELGELSEESTV